MKYISIDFSETSAMPEEALSKGVQKLTPFLASLSTENLIFNKFAQLPHQKDIDLIINMAEQKKQLQPAAIIIIGIGGSCLGTMAIQQALLGNLYNESSHTIKIYYADSIDNHYVHSLLALAESHLKNGQSILLNVISKSGATTETIINFELFLALLQRYNPTNYKNNIIVTTDRNSLLWNLAEQESWQILEIPGAVGGRYSVFSAASLFPLALLDIDISAIIKGAEYATHNCLQQTLHNNALLSAIWSYELYQASYFTWNLFLFSNRLSALGKWWQQLTAESLGKSQKNNGALNSNGLLPIISIGTADLHATGQLFFANINKIVTTFIAYTTQQDSLMIPNYPNLFSSIVQNIQNTELTTIMNTILQAVQHSYEDKKMPYRTITIPEDTPFYMGALLRQFMFETVYVAELLNVNPFDQPSVEMYKQKTRKILANE